MSDNRQTSVAIAMQQLVDCRSCGELPHMNCCFLSHLIYIHISVNDGGNEETDI
jgi:hypothetical protein